MSPSEAGARRAGFLLAAAAFVLLALTPRLLSLGAGPRAEVLTALKAAEHRAR